MKPWKRRGGPHAGDGSLRAPLPPVSFAAFERYLDYGGPDLIPAVKLLVRDYCRYALDRAWFYYPDALPKEAVATSNRNGYICCNLNFPVEDLYPDGQQAGQVG